MIKKKLRKRNKQKRKKVETKKSINEEERREN